MDEETGGFDTLDATGIEEALDATLYADGETLVQTAGGTIQGADPSITVNRGSVIGRYTILDLLGAGAMGVVYTAYDPKLDRRVALKLLRIPKVDNGTQMVARLIREAQALAKLNHPNVVTIHDCDTLGDHVYLAMELVEGTTLSRWLRDGPRSTAEILDSFRQAARGLGAAHQVGLVHRDFKPDNVLIGLDGRIRVADFGIARNADEDSEEEAPAEEIPDSSVRTHEAESSTARLTQTGALVGTPAYMAPEQHLGVHVDARCDQFAFCVALYEALYEAHPFPCKSYFDLRRQVLSGEVTPPPTQSDVPPQVREAILRGLEVVPDKRFPTMEALLKALRDEPRSQRFAILGLLAALFAIIVIGSIMSRPPRSCADSERHFRGIWDQEARKEAEQAFAATGRPYAATSWKNSSSALNRYSADWMTMRREACEATAVYHEQSAELLDLRMACLDRHLRRFAATAKLFREADSAVVLRAVNAAEALPTLDACADTEALLRDGSEEDPRSTEDFARLDQLLAEAAALETTSRYEASLVLSKRALDLARELGSTRSEAKALFTMASTMEQQGRSEEAAELLLAAAIQAERNGVDALRGEIWSLLALIEGISLGRHGEAERRLRHTFAIFERSRAAPLAQAHLKSRLGAILTAQGHYDEALDTLRGVLPMLETMPLEHSMVRLSTLNIIGSVYDLRGDPEAALANYRRALAIAEDKFGSDHPESAKILNNIAIVEKSQGNFQAALADYHRVLTIRRGAYDPDHPEIGAALSNLGNLYLAMGRYADAITYYREALEILSQTAPGSQLSGRLFYNIGVSHHLEGRYLEAVESYRRSLEVSEAIYPADHPEIAYPLAGLGSALVELGHDADAREPLERALAIRSRKDVTPIDIGEIRFALARALPSDEHERAQTLAHLARDDYAALGDSEMITHIDTWIATPTATSSDP
ncbi:MAG TPA: tetratricopeptide repeat protein [Nannocystis exedens]|nr:tetratricopeptide repeat protein [Nannocystis exedens]